MPGPLLHAASVVQSHLVGHHLMEPLAQQEGNSLRVDGIFLNKHIPVVSGITQVLVSVTTNIQGDNITALYTHRDLAILLQTHQGTKVRQT